MSAEVDRDAIREEIEEYKFRPLHLPEGIEGMEGSSDDEDDDGAMPES